MPGPSLYTTAERSLLEELESVVERRLRSPQLSLGGVASVMNGLAEKAAARLQDAQSLDAYDSDDGGDDGDGWKDGKTLA